MIEFVRDFSLSCELVYPRNIPDILNSSVRNDILDQSSNEAGMAAPGIMRRQPADFVNGNCRE
jgi:hypothetical protein